MKSKYVLIMLISLKHVRQPQGEYINETGWKQCSMKTMRTIITSKQWSNGSNEERYSDGWATGAPRHLARQHVDANTNGGAHAQHGEVHNAQHTPQLGVAKIHHFPPRELVHNGRPHLGWWLKRSLF